MLLAWLFVRIARPAGRPAWGLPTCAFATYFAYMFRAIIVPASDGIHQLQVRVGLGYEYGLGQWQNGLLQAAFPLALGLWTWWRIAHPAKSVPCRDDLEPSKEPAAA
jgi:hypothetical protein